MPITPVTIESGNGLVPSGNKPLPEPMLTDVLSPYGVTRGQLVDVVYSENMSIIGP